MPIEPKNCPLNIAAAILLTFILSFPLFSQNASEDKPETVVTEEIKVNLSSFDSKGNFAAGLGIDDLIISEDNSLHQASSLKRVSANVLLLLDLGSEIPYAKNQKVTRDAAKGLIDFLDKDDSISIIQYHDRVELISDWSKDRAQIMNTLDKKIGAGRRSLFNDALKIALDHFLEKPLQNCHLVIISDGIDSFKDEEKKDIATKQLLGSNINVHVISYTVMQRAIIEPRMGNIREGEHKPKRLPEEIVETLPDPKGAGKKEALTPRKMAKMPRLIGWNLDKEMKKDLQGKHAALIEAEDYLSAIANDTNGEIFLPESAAEILEKTRTLARNIDSQYVLTYIPKRPLNEIKSDEYRLIEVTSRRSDIIIQARKKLFVKANPLIEKN